MAAWAILAIYSMASCGNRGDDQVSATSTTLTTTEASTTAAVDDTKSATSENSVPTSRSVDVFFSFGDGSDCSQVRPFSRTIAIEGDPVAAAFAELVAGPTAEEMSSGATSFFSVETAAAIKSTEVMDGLLMVDFVDLRPIMPNASTSCGSAALIAQLNGTAFQFESIQRTRYEIDGSCETFGNWLQRECFESDRASSSDRPDDAGGEDDASGSGCSTDVVDGLPDGLWFGFVFAAEVGEVLFDLACWFSGPAAIVAASEDGEESPPPNDYHIRNVNERLRLVAVDPNAEVSWLPEPGDPASLSVTTYDTWAASRLDRSFQPGVWLNVSGGWVTSIEEQYVP